MSEQSWPEGHSYSVIDLEGTDPGESMPTVIATPMPEPSTPTGKPLDRRRQKAAVLLTVVWGSTIALHGVSWGLWLVLGVTTLMGVHALRILRVRPHTAPPPLDIDDAQVCPYVSLLVAAKNEEAVIAQLVESLCQLDYPRDRYDLWIIDDNSSDQTPVILQQLAQKYSHLRVIRRLPGAAGGKSGALNHAWPQAAGEILAVFDADAQVPADLLRRVLPLFAAEQVGAVQVRKAIANANYNLWTRCQAAEMALDSCVQQQRIAIGGIGELRGNGQFIRRIALESCGGFNEATITDDLDLTLHLHIQGWDIEFLNDVAVLEEGVTTAIGLWHQRNRWAEGGYQRYLDYWKPLLRNRLGPRKTYDLVMFWLIQYILPTAAVPDLLMAYLRNRPPLLSPIVSLAIGFSMLSMMMGLRRTQQQPLWVNLWQTLQANVYLLHWMLVIATMAMRISVRPKQLKWVKTIHHGEGKPLTARGSSKG
ncbi:glycosyltransferase [Trichothermofontia sp.]